VLRRLAFAAALAFSVATDATAAAGRWPLFAGSLAGELTPFGEDGPRLRWRVTAHPPESEIRRFSWQLDGEGVAARGTVTATPATGAFAWAIESATLPLSAWLPVVARRFSLPLDGVEAGGRVQVEGEGDWTGEKPSGTLRVRWEDGSLRAPDGGWELSGIGAAATYSLAGDGEAAVSVAALRYGPLALTEGGLDVRLGSDLRASVARLEVKGLGGTITLDPFDVPLAQPAAAVTVRLAGLALEDLLALLPEALAAARGRLDGEFGATWSAAEGLQLGAGWLALAEGADASVRLVPTPGLITGQLDASNPAYAPLQRVELGRTALDVSLLRASFTPNGDANGRTATLRLQAEPVDPQLKAPLVIDINVAGPLDRLLKLGMDGRVSF
jgi:hypothetical protein